VRHNERRVPCGRRRDGEEEGEEGSRSRHGGVGKTWSDGAMLTRMVKIPFQSKFEPIIYIRQLQKTPFYFSLQSKSLLLRVDMDIPHILSMLVIGILLTPFLNLLLLPQRL
jgi:hypothetical protein